MTASYRFFLILITRHICGAAKAASVIGLEIGIVGGAFRLVLTNRG